MATGRGTLVATRLHVGRSGRVRGRPVMLALVGVLALVGALILGVGLGTVAIAPGDTIAIIAHRLFGLDLGATWTPATETIVWDLRLPRVLTAMVVGTALAVAGATFQGLLRNPLADPYVLGSASGAALGAAIAVLLPIRRRVPRVRAAPRTGVRRRAARDARRLPAVAAERPLADDEPPADRLRRRVAAGRRAGARDVPVRRGAAADLRLPAGRLRPGLVGAARRRRPDHPHRQRADRWAGPGRSTGCCSARRRRATSASTSNASGRSSSAWRRS